MQALHPQVDTIHLWKERVIFCLVLHFCLWIGYTSATIQKAHQVG
jgi:hypothetical protein